MLRYGVAAGKQKAPENRRLSWKILYWDQNL